MTLSELDLASGFCLKVSCAIEAIPHLPVPRFVHPVRYAELPQGGIPNSVVQMPMHTSCMSTHVLGQEPFPEEMFLARYNLPLIEIINVGD